jgi:hypothetical protein
VERSICGFLRRLRASPDDSEGGGWSRFIQRDEPVELEYGGSKKLTGLATVLGEPTAPWAAGLRDLKLTPDDRQRIESELGHISDLQEWLS